MHIKLSDALIVFDLDDTLYPEADYVASGVRYVSERIHKLYKKDIFNDLNNELKKNPRIDWLAFACEHAELPEMVKESLLWDYRLHEPVITLSAEVKSTLHVLQSNTTLVILSDGRSITQRLKLKALGLSHFPLYISQEFGSEKPEILRFRQITLDFPERNYIYVGDNPSKDFLAPNSMGWVTIGLRGNERNIHRTDLDGFEEKYLPHIWVEKFSDILSVLDLRYAALP